MSTSSKHPSDKGLLVCLRLSLPLFATLVSGCGSFLPNSGPTASALYKQRQSPSDSSIKLIELTPEVVHQINARRKTPLFSDMLRPGSSNGSALGAGDSVEVSVFEAPPASLFSSGTADPRGAGGSRMTTLPEQVIHGDGSINIPFAGRLSVAGLQVRDIEENISTQLREKANQPQILVRQTRNATSHVTVVGEVNTSIRMPITPARERLLDAIAAAGGLRQPVNKVMVQITRGSTLVSLPLETVIADPRQNIQLAPGDVVTAVSQPLSFTALGATGKNEEINFEAKGITLAQALARAGGLADSRSNSRGVFIFRFEDPRVASVVSPGSTKPVPRTKSSVNTEKGSASNKTKTPVVYSLNLRNPGSFFLAKGFTMKDGDTLYISNAPAAELQKFMNIVSTVASPIMGGITTSAIVNRP
jgi:polysaccharide export outer membrane protein